MNSTGGLNAPYMFKSPRFVLAVPNLTASAAFYRDVLGFTVHDLAPGWSLFERDSCVIMAGECPDAPGARTIGDHSYFAYVEVEPIDDFYTGVVARGAEVIKTLRQEPWGMREFGIRTTDGHRVMFGSRAPSVLQQNAQALTIDPTIVDFYERMPEEDRLEQGEFLLEALRTRELIERYAPRAPATVIDIGGGAGAYALWLAEAGYAVHLIDASPRLVAEARRRSGTRRRPLASCEVGDARATKRPNGAADIVLLLGPLYHLTTTSDRVAALVEAARVLKPGGYLFAAAISRWASAIDGLARDLFKDPDYTPIVERDISEGQHRPPDGRLDYFTTAYFHRPEDFQTEAGQAGFNVDGILGIEGPGWMLPDIQVRMGDPRHRADILRVARMLESEPSAVAMSAHMLLIACKPAT